MRRPKYIKGMPEGRLQPDEDEPELYCPQCESSNVTGEGDKWEYTIFCEDCGAVTSRDNLP